MTAVPAAGGAGPDVAGLVETAARAMFAHDWPDDAWPTGDADWVTRDEYLANAEAALAAVLPLLADAAEKQLTRYCRSDAAAWLRSLAEEVQR